MKDTVYLVLTKAMYYIGIYTETEFLVFSALTSEEFRILCAFGDEYRYRIFIEPYRLSTDSIIQQYAVIDNNEISTYIRKYKLKQLLSIL